MKKLYLDAGTTWSKVIETNASEKSDFFSDFEKYFKFRKEDLNYYIIPSAEIKKSSFMFDKATGHMSLGKVRENNLENEIIALANGAKHLIKDNSIIFDLGSRDAKWIKFSDGKFKDLDWNTTCAGSTGATVEMLLKFYNVKLEDLEVCEEKYAVNCGIFGLEKIMDDVANGEEPKICISKFIHGLAFNVWNFAKNPEELYLSGGFCENKCFVKSLEKYCKVHKLGRFILVESFLKE